MGWQQYSCRLRLSRTNIYILYINRATSKPSTELRLFATGAWALYSGVGRPGNPGGTTTRASPEIALPPGKAVFEPSLEPQHRRERAFRFGGNGLGRVQFQLISTGSKCGRQVPHKAVPWRVGMRCLGELARAGAVGKPAPSTWLAEPSGT